MLKRKLFILISVLIFLWLSFGLLLYISQNKILYPADITAFSICPDLEKSEKISTDGFRGYLTKRSLDKIIIYYHGNGGRACDRAFMDTFFGSLGYSTLLVEYPGYAEIDKATTMKGILDEVRSIKDYIATLKFKEIVIVSESVGTGPAAYHVNLENSNVSKLILITPYSNIADVAFHRFPVYPMRFLIKDNFRPDKWLLSSTIPISIILAENDEIIGVGLGRKLFETILSSKKEMYIVKDAGHNSIYSKEDLFLILSNIIK